MKKLILSVILALAASTGIFAVEFMSADYVASEFINDSAATSIKLNVIGTSGSIYVRANQVYGLSVTPDSLELCCSQDVHYKFAINEAIPLKAISVFSYQAGCLTISIDPTKFN